MPPTTETEVEYRDAEIVSRCAEAAHEMNRILCESQGDMSQPRWADAPEWQRTSAINGVRGAIAGNTPEQSHASWMAEKVATGWVYGPRKDAAAKQHPCMVAYAELPPSQRAKDALYIATVAAMRAALVAE
jgi:hypothetical protein